MALNADQIAAMGRATLDAMPSTELDEIGGWLVPIDEGTVSRSRSAVPLRHDVDLAADIDRIITRYCRAGAMPRFRIPETEPLTRLQTRLCALGYRSGPASLVMTRPCTLLPIESSPVTLSNTADDGWCAAFLGTGSDKVDGRSRLTILRRAKHARFASVAQSGATVAVGAGSFSREWVSIHGLRTDPAHRNRGLASAIVAAILADGIKRAFSRVFLQVEVANTDAVRLYRRLGFADLWTYRYWSHPAASD